MLGAVLKSLQKIGVPVVAVVAVCAAVFSTMSSSQADESVEGERPLIVLFSGPDFTGRRLVVSDSLADLPVERGADGVAFDWNDEVRSVRVLRGTWRLYQHGRCNTFLDETPLAELDVRAKPVIAGWSTVVSATSQGALDLASPEMGGMQRDISSIRLLSRRNLPDWASVR